MQRKRLTKKQRRIRAYVTRAIVALILVVMVVLMFCGCLYIRDLFTKDKDTSKDDRDSQVVNEDEPEAQLFINDEEELKYKDFKVVLDAGHGGYDGGTQNGDIIEKDLNLLITTELQSLLEAQGITVTMTRDTDEFVSLDNRISISNQTDSNIFVSLHCNFFEGDDSIDGFEVFYIEGEEGGQTLAENIAGAAQDNPNIAVRGSKANRYYVTKHVDMDAVLIEMGFLSNPAECQKLANSDYQKQIAKAIADGIFREFDTRKTTTE